jgi:enamine deaminase RidA (YjgF/YER057c/UK114 family)
MIKIAASAATFFGGTMAEIKIFSPETLGRPRGQYSQITRVKAAETLYIAGQVAADANGTIIGDGDFDAQCTQIFANIEAALAACGAGWKDVVQFTTYLVDADDIPKFFAYRLRAFPAMFPDGVYPPNTLLIVSRLVEEPFKVEVQTIAAL